MILLGVDGGNSRTRAAVASADGAVLGRGQGGCGDIYGATVPALAIAEIVAAASGAMATAGVAADDVTAAVCSLAGADWPEDITFLRDEIGQALGLTGRVSVVNDSIGALRLAGPLLTGVAVVVGTGAAIGAARDGRVYHLGFWPDGMGARALGQAAWRAVYLHELGIGPETTLTARTLTVFDAATPIDLLHALTRRGGLGMASLTRLVPAVLDEAAAGDAAATAIVAQAAGQLADIAGHCAARVGLNGSTYPLVLTGGVLTHPHAALLTTPVIDRLAGAEPMLPSAPPLAGALLLACDGAGIDPPRGFGLEA